MKGTFFCKAKIFFSSFLMDFFFVLQYLCCFPYFSSFFLLEKTKQKSNCGFLIFMYVQTVHYSCMNHRIWMVDSDLYYDILRWLMIHLLSDSVQHIFNTYFNTYFSLQKISYESQINSFLKSFKHQNLCQKVALYIMCVWVTGRAHTMNNGISMN